MAYEDIVYENRGPATWITLNRPDTRNALRPKTYTELALSGVLIDAAEADRIGLVSRVVPAAELTGAVEAMTEQLSWGAPLAQRAAKRAMVRGLSMEWQAFDEYVAPLADGLWSTADHREGVSSHVERRRPRFEGR